VEVVAVPQFEFKEPARSGVFAAMLSLQALADPAWALRHHARELDSSTFDYVALMRPGDALRFAPDRLCASQFARAVLCAPEEALRFARELLSDDQLAACARRVSGGPAPA